MPRSPSKDGDPIVVLPPPVLSVSPNSNRYNLVLDLKWGDFDQQVSINREFAFEDRLVKELNRALLEGTESNPYLIHDGR